MAETAMVFQDVHVSSWVFLKFQEGMFWLVQGFAWLRLSWQAKGLRQLVDFPGQPSPSTSVDHLNVQECKQKW